MWWIVEPFCCREVRREWRREERVSKRGGTTRPKMGVCVEKELCGGFSDRIVV